MIRFEVEYLEQVREFFREIPIEATQKLIYNINKAQQVNDVSVFKKLKNTDIWEFRAKVKGNQYRVFAFWDINKNKVVVCTHGLIKKTQKTPKKDIDKAEQLRKKYLGL